MLVAADAGKDRVIARVGMAHGACIVGMSAAADGKLVSEGGARPAGGRVAGSTSCRKSGCNMIGVSDARVPALVAGVAGGGSARVHPCDMATSAWNGRVRSGELEAGSAVVERGRSPGCGRVTDHAILRESGCNMARIHCAGVTAQMA
jgi:hypothetical protein